MSRPLRVLHIIDTLSVGGAEQLILSLAKHIDRRMVELHVCGLSVILGNALEGELTALGVPVTVVGARSFYDPRTTLQIMRYIRRHRIDVVHTHLTHADIVGRLAARLNGRPVVSTFHNQPSNYTRERADLRWLEYFTARYLATHLIAVSSRIREMFIAEWKIPGDHISTIYNSVPMDQLLPIPEPSPALITPDEPVITNIGRLARQKGQRVLLEAAKIVVQRYPGARFQIVGQGRLERALRDQAAELGITASITFLGMRRDVPEILAGSDLFVLSSLWEGMPLTVVEAMAAARPMVLTDVGANAELIAHGEQGLIVPPNDAQALADAIIALLADGETRARFGRVAREQVRWRFSMETYTRQHEALYTALATKRRFVPISAVREDEQVAR